MKRREENVVMNAYYLYINMKDEESELDLIDSLRISKMFDFI